MIADRVLRISRRRTVAIDVVELELEDAGGAPLPRWAPGAHVELVLGERLVRAYSLLGDPAAPTWRIAVLRAPRGRGGSAFVHAHLDAGASVPVRGPRNHFPLEPATSHLFIAGGIGITPLLPMLRVAARWQLVYGGRSRRSMAYLDELPAGPVDLWPEDERGLVDLASVLAAAPEDALVYACGPESLLAALERACPGRLRVERFGALPSLGPRESFEVELRRSGRTLTVAPEQSILDAALAAGVEVLSSCGEGVCGTCETPLLEGVADHRDSYYTAEEHGRRRCIFPCVSRAKTPRLVLDL